MLVVAIDGPSGVGKSTLARRLAVALGTPYLNTGSMYRAVTLAALREGTNLDDGDALAGVASRMTFALAPIDGATELTIDGAAPGPDLTSLAVEAAVSRVSAHRALREVLRAEQRRLSRGGGVVEGRDIGSVVCPDADVKLFLTAAADERAARRAGERGIEPTPIADALRRRDARDARVNPFVPAPDALEINTSDKDADAVFAEALALVRSAVEAR